MQRHIMVRCNGSCSSHFVVLTPNEYRAGPPFEEEPESEKAWIHKITGVIPLASRPMLTQ